MSIRSVLLRLLLALVLVLDGTATAMAAVHMSHVDKPAAASQVASTANAGAEGEMPCHDAGQAKVATTAHPGSGGHLHASPGPGTPSPDCCESGVCSCACMHPVHATAATEVVSLASIEHGDSVRPMFSVHASPALPHLIRPPIV
ncbi:CopL family metal-binding regulatory protein [Coralloluteibacterium stylophorae]|uniref:CopL family metal-binding regulatory protein n=1 Tax=Coralloluteibacterium stylophorae TaxID=1776034 RepID=A0A8J7VU81_9GAMM|nr:CopL family metal-binding regulatory protein [Coralloluteibacterium stylophorae]MBS7457915.1 CopL family metal-binding regulatory protein [Coralloluteibacterium stylophorae]